MGIPTTNQHGCVCGVCGENLMRARAGVPHRFIVLHTIYIRYGTVEDDHSGMKRMKVE